MDEDLPFDVVTSWDDQYVKFLILPTVQKMQQIKVEALRILIKDGKVLFDMIPRKNTSDGDNL